MFVDIREKNYKLLMIGKSNWDYYLDTKLNCTLSVVKKGNEYIGCKNSIFGSIEYFRKWFLYLYEKDLKIKESLTEKGLEIIGI